MKGVISGEKVKADRLSKDLSSWTGPRLQIHGFFRNHLKENGLSKVDGILADLGISSHQINSNQRGFSFKGNEKLDMRMNNDLEFNDIDLLNTYNKDQLINIFSIYGEIKNSKQLANSIVRLRRKKKIEKTIDLIGIINPFSKKKQRRKVLCKSISSYKN